MQQKRIYNFELSRSVCNCFYFYVTLNSAICFYYYHTIYKVLKTISSNDNTLHNMFLCGSVVFCVYYVNEVADFRKPYVFHNFLKWDKNKTFRYLF